MLACELENVSSNDYLSERFQKAYEWLRTTDLDAVKVGSYPVDGDDVIANVQEYSTAPAEDLRFETHDVYYDVQYVISGHERFGVVERDGLVPVEVDPSNDISFYEEPATCSEVILNPGDLVVVPPEQGHKPRCAVGDPEPIRKVVVKVRR